MSSPISIFISYRRADSGEFATELHDYLTHTLPRANVFQDIDDIPLGDAFDIRMFTELNQADIVLIIIGQKWLTLRAPNAAENAIPRIFDPRDYVHKEIDRSLTDENKTVIPIFVQGTRMPKKRRLPSEIDSLFQRNGLTISEDYTSLEEELVSLIKRIQKKAAELGKPDPTLAEDVQDTTLDQTSDNTQADMEESNLASDDDPKRIAETKPPNTQRFSKRFLALIGGTIALLSGIAGLLGFFDIDFFSFFPDQTEPTIRRAVIIQRIGNTSTCPTSESLTAELDSRLSAEQRFADVSIIENPSITIPDTITGRLDIDLNCNGDGETIFRYVSSGSMLGLWEVDSVVLHQVTPRNIVNISLLLLDYVDVETRPLLVNPDRLDRQLPQLVSNEPTLPQYTPDIGCDIAPLSSQETPVSSDLAAQLTILGAHSALFSENDKYLTAERYYRQVMFGNEAYSTLAQIGYAYSLMDRMTELRDAQATGTYDPAEEFGQLEQQVHCILDAIIAGNNPTMRYLANISKSAALNHALLSAVSQTNYLVPDFEDNPEKSRAQLAHDACTSATTLRDEVAANLHYLSDYCFGITEVMWTTYTPVLEDVEMNIDRIAQLLLLDAQDQSSLVQNSWLDALYWRAYTALQAEDTFATCIANLDVLQTHLEGIEHIGNTNRASPLPHTFQQMMVVAQFTEFCDP